MCMGLSKNICQSDTFFLCVVPVLTAPMRIEVSDVRVGEGNVNITTISWKTPPGGVESYTFYYTTPRGTCGNVTIGADMTSHDVEHGKEMQIASHRNDMTKCSPGIIYSCNNPYILHILVTSRYVATTSISATKDMLAQLYDVQSEGRRPEGLHHNCASILCEHKGHAATNLLPFLWLPSHYHSLTSLM